MKILGISLSTRDIGIALMSQGQLIGWKTHSFHGTWSVYKLDSILSRCDRYITRYRISQVVIKIPPETHHSKAFLLLLKNLSELAVYRGCMIVCKTKEDIKELVPGVTNTETLMEYVTRNYPILLPQQAQELKSRRPYHLKMFEAVLTAHVIKETICK